MEATRQQDRNDATANPNDATAKQKRCDSSMEATRQQERNDATANPNDATARWQTQQEAADQYMQEKWKVYCSEMD
jgi:hypothetical protein